MQRGADRGAGARGERTPHLLSARRRQLTARRPGPGGASAGLVWLAVWQARVGLMAAAPSPAGCEAWAASDECLRNPAFMWAECASACAGRGLVEPWAALDAQARAAPNPQPHPHPHLNHKR